MDDRSPAGAVEVSSADAGGALICRGSELVHLVEQLYVHFLRLVLVVMLVGCGLSVSLGSQTSTGSPRLLTVLVAGLGAIFAVGGLASSSGVYCWLRYNRIHQVAPGAVAALVVAVNGPDSASWWVALPLLWIVAVVGSTRLGFGAALVTAGAYLGGTLLGGEPLVNGGDNGILAAAIGLPVNTMAGRYASEAFARFVLRLHQLERRVTESGQLPLRIDNLAPAPPAETRGRAASTRSADAPCESAADHARVALRLTARQLEVALLACDGLRQGEIAVCLGISPRQIERLMHDARERAGAETTSHLVAMLVLARLSPAA